MSMVTGADGISRSTSSGDNWVIVDGVPYKMFPAHTTIASAQTDQAWIAGEADYKMRVVQMDAQAAATATDITVNNVDSGADTALQLTALGVRTEWDLPLNAAGYFESIAAGDGLSLTSGTGSTISVFAFYIKVAA